MKEIIEEDQELEMSQVVTGKKEFLDLLSHGSFDAVLIDISVGEREGGVELLHDILKRKGISLLCDHVVRDR